MRRLITVASITVTMTLVGLSCTTRGCWPRRNQRCPSRCRRARRLPDRTDNTLTFTFVATSQSTSRAWVTIPASASGTPWSPPQSWNPSGPGYVTVQSLGCNSAVLAEIFGTGPWTLGVEHKCGNNKSFALTYRATAATRADTYVFATRVTVGQVILPTTEQPVVTVTPGPADRFAVTGLVTAIAGAVQLATATALDASGNVVTGYGGAAAIASSDAQAVLPGTGSFVNGVRLFFVSLATAGSQTVSATDGLVTGGQTVTITAAAASVMTLTGLADTTAAGASQSGFVTLFDAYSNVARGYAGTVHFTSSDVNATLPGDHTFVAADNGIYPFTGLVLKKVGSTSITVADTVTASLQAGTTETVSPGAAASLTLQWGDGTSPLVSSCFPAPAIAA